jgi:hypothetical protein
MTIPQKHEELFDKVQGQLHLLAGLLKDLPQDDFVLPSTVLSGATVGEHVRHVIEMFYCLINNYEYGVVNYDKRERNLSIQTNKQVAQNLIFDLHSDIVKLDRKMVLQMPCCDGAGFVDIETNFLRELLYNLEHCVHHMALIRIGVQAMQPSLVLSEAFGVADSTIAYRKQA